MIKYCSLLVLLGFTITACQVTPINSLFFNLPSGAVLFQDDFSDASSGWENFSKEGYGTLDYFDGYYRIEVEGNHSLLWTGPGMNFSNVHLEVDTIKVIGSEDDIYGIVCRAVDDNNFYFFVISSDGYYGIGKMTNGIQSLIGMPGMLPSEVIFQDKAANHLSADCMHDQLTFYANGNELNSVADSDLINGDVGLIHGTLQASDNVVLFDNFIVVNP